MRTAFADGDDAFTGGWDQRRFDEVFEDIREAGTLGTIGYSAVQLTELDSSRRRHPSARPRIPRSALPQPHLIQGDKKAHREPQVINLRDYMN